MPEHADGRSQADSWTDTEFTSDAPWATWESELHSVGETEITTDHKIELASSIGEQSHTIHVQLKGSDFWVPLRQGVGWVRRVQTGQAQDMVGRVRALHDTALSTTTSESFAKDFGEDFARRCAQLIVKPNERDRVAMDIEYVLRRLTRFMPKRQAVIWLESHNHHLAARPIDAIVVSGTAEVIATVDAQEALAY